ncbi:MAG: ATP-binding protein, partial [Muribaculaceae bacterium]|nr:ATP-binding protein [Muribaculaceae bacterium]
IRLSIAFSADPVYVPVDVVQFQQVLVNIVKNSVESIGTAMGGYVNIEVCGAMRPELVVTDNGAGISPEAACNLFSPFYTTKPDGSGIGLTMTAEVLKKHNCRFSLITSDDDGLTRFTIKFPKHY